MKGASLFRRFPAFDWRWAGFSKNRGLHHRIHSNYALWQPITYLSKSIARVLVLQPESPAFLLFSCALGCLALAPDSFVSSQAISIHYTIDQFHGFLCAQKTGANEPGKGQYSVPAPRSVVSSLTVLFCDSSHKAAWSKPW